MNTDNQQQTVSDLELGWLAGIIEGEGNISMTLTGHTQKRIGGVPLRVDPRVIITNTDKLIIEKCIDILGRLGVGKWVTHTKPNNVGLVTTSSKDITYIYIQGFKRMSRFLGYITSCFAGEKKKRCEVMKRFVDKRLLAGKGVLYDKEDVGLLLDFLRLTRSPNYEKIAGMLNEHTRDGRTKESRRCALDSRETVRVGAKSPAAA